MRRGHRGRALAHARECEARGQGRGGRGEGPVGALLGWGEIWAAEAAGSWNSEDKRYAALTEQYAGELGAEAGPYVAPSFRLLSATLDTLPNPLLNDEDTNEKIELGE
ncbi:MXAN_6521/LA_1396 family lipoprotein [Cystobacter fuscus]